jgi:hypothetical protein
MDTIIAAASGRFKMPWPGAYRKSSLAHHKHRNTEIFLLMRKKICYYEGGFVLSR